MDIFLFQTIDDGEINVTDGIVEMSGGLDTAAYLSLFGGNEDCSGRPTCPFSWWGNFSETDKALKYVSETQFLLKELPVTTGNLGRIEEAVRRDLQWFLDKKIASSIDIIVSIPAINQIKINVTIEAQGLESNFEFVENWKAMINPPVEPSGSIAINVPPPPTTLISCDLSTNRIYVHDGISGATIDDFASPATNPTGLAFDGTNLISCDITANKIYVHDGISEDTLDFASPAFNPTGLTIANGDLISCDTGASKIYVHDGISEIIKDEFTSPGTAPYGLAFDGTNLISCNRVAGSGDRIYVHDGISEPTIDDFASPATDPYGLACDGENLISCDLSTNRIYVHDGISEPTIDDFASPVSNPSGLTMV